MAKLTPELTRAIEAILTEHRVTDEEQIRMAGGDHATDLARRIWRGFRDMRFAQTPATNGGGAGAEDDAMPMRAPEQFAATR